MGKMNFSVMGMSCAACSAAVERAVSALSGVEKAPVNLLTNSMTVFYDDSVYSTEDMLTAAVKAAVEKAGYGAEPKAGSAFSGRTAHVNKPVSSTSMRSSASDADVQSSQLKKQFITSLILLIPLMYIAMHQILPFPVPVFISAVFDGPENALVSWLTQLILLVPVLFVNRRYFSSGFTSLIHRNPTMNSLVATGCTAAVLYSIGSFFTASYLAGHGRISEATGLHVYFDSAAMILTIITLGKWLESRGKAKTSRAVEELIKLAPDTAIIETADGEKEVPVEQVSPGTIVIVKAGCRIPVDGTVSGGSSSVDESAITGESVPVAKKEGDPVTAATMNMTATLRVLTTATGKDTSFAKIIALVEEASASKAPIARAADTAARYFVPAVLIIAFITFIAWFVSDATVAFALTSAVSVLVISCPCALGLATPVAIMAGTGQGARNGILFKDGAVLEELSHIDTVVLDKTGTITRGIVRDIADGSATGPKVDTSADTIREDSPAAVKRMKAMGLSVIMLSGDKEERAYDIAAQCGIDEVIAGVRPDGKEEVIRGLQEKGRKVAMIGDGINDAPALTRAEAGIAIGAGTDVAIESADIILVRNSLSDAAAAFALGRKVIRIIKQNLFWALCYNAACIPLAAGVFYKALGWQLNPMIGSAAMGLSSICVVTNALRLTRMKLRGTETLEKQASAANKADGAHKENDMRDVEIVIKGMMCSHCSGRVEAALNAIDGVEAKVDLAKNTAFVKASNAVTGEALAKAVTDAGYTVVSVK